MLRKSRFMLVSALTLAIAVPAFAFLAGTGKITGKVNGEDGKVAVGVPVRVMTAPPAKKKEKSAEPPAGGQGEKKLPAPIAEGTTDSNGAFTLTVPVGDYVVQAGDRKSGLRAVERVSVTEDGTVDVTLNLKKYEPKKKEKAAK